MEELLLKLGYNGIEHLLAQLQTLNHYDIPTASYLPSTGNGNAVWGSITGNIANQKDLANALAKLQKEIEEATIGKISSVFIYKGTVATEAELPSSDMEIGYCYNVQDTGANYVWNGEGWDKLSETVNLSAYLTKEEFEETRTLYYVKDEINNLLNQMYADLSTNIAVKADKTALEEQKEYFIDLHNGVVDGVNAEIEARKAADNELSALIHDINVSISNLATKTEVNAIADDVAALKSKNLVELTDISTEENPNRNAIILNNHDGIFGKTTDNQTGLIAMLSKYNVVDIGSNKTHTNLNTSQIITVNDTQAVLTDALLERIVLAGENVSLNKTIATDEATGFQYNAYTINVDAYTKEETDNKIDNIQSTLDNSLANQDGNLQTILLRMEELQKQIIDLKSMDPEVVVFYEGGDTEYTNKEKDFMMSGAITSNTSISGNSITLKETTITAASIELLAAQDVIIKDLTLTGSVPKAIADSLISVKADGYISIRDAEINPENCYKGIEINLEQCLAKSVTIENVDFAGHVVNNAINLYGMAENGVVTVSNCHFADVYNAFQIANRNNNPWTLNIINCTFDKWETGQYGGMITLQDISSTSQEEANTRNIFNKLTINIQNCTKPDGTKITMPEDLNTICCSRDDKQIIYMWDSYRNFTEYSENVYPKINIT